jgi:hypothetical protein
MGHVFGLCRLCSRDADLRNSHFMPKAAYRLLRDPNLKNPHPYMLRGNESVQTARQMTAYLFCERCEGRFSDQGESYVMRSCYRGSGKFLLRDALLRTKPLEIGDEIDTYSASEAPDVRSDELAYFEDFRRYLLGETEFPDQVSLYISVSSLELLPLTAFPPVGKNAQGFHFYYFAIPGVTFRLFVGSRIPENLRRGCFVRSPQKLIYVTAKDDIANLSDRVRQLSKLQSV